jgi:hypothetical protein
MKRVSPFWILTLLAASTRAQEAAPIPSETLKAECATAYAETQRQRQEGKQIEALKNAVFCAQASCPELLVGDCTRWISELEASLPSIVFEARAADGGALSDVRVSIDGALLAAKLDGRALQVNPGEHQFVFEHGAQRVERRFVVVEGRKNQRLSVQFAAAGPAAPGPAPAQSGSQGLHPGVIVSGGLALLGAAGFVYFGTRGNQRSDELESECAPRCSDDELDPVRRDWLVADVSLGVGVVSLGALTWFLISGSSERPAAAVELGPERASVRYRTRF